MTVHEFTVHAGVLSCDMLTGWKCTFVYIVNRPESHELADLLRVNK
jgi:hypothetical protein